MTAKNNEFPLDMKAVKKELDEMFDNYKPNQKKEEPKVIDLVERVARANQKERDAFTRGLVEKWPLLAKQIMDNIQVEIFETRMKEEEENLERISKEARMEDEPLVLTEEIKVSKNGN
mgnify:FL=1